MRSSVSLLCLIPLGAALAWGCSSDPDPVTTGATSTTGSGGSGGTGGGEPPPAYCEGSTAYVYDPSSKDITTFPDDVLTIDDATSPTGLRVHMIFGETVNPPTGNTTFETVFKDISTLDGFGTTAGLTMVFSGPLDPSSLPSVEATMKSDASAVLVRIDGEKAEPVPFEWSLVPEKEGDPKTTLAVRPMVPLAPKARYGFAVTTRARDAGGGCLAPSPVMRELLEGKAADPKLDRVAGKIGELVAKLKEAGTIAHAEDLSAAAVFTTQHTVDDSAAIAANIRKKAVEYQSAGPCDASGEAYVVCQGSFQADDYRVNKRAIDEATLAPQASYTLKVTTWLPKTGKAPYPTILFGHGLNGDRTQGEELAALAAPLGYATVAIDAVSHGDHPDGHGAFGAAVDFFGLSFNLKDPLDSLSLRDNFRQSTYDKLQLLEALRPGIDADGDGAADVGVDKLMYLGVSLGGIMSSEFLAFAPEVDVALPIVPGARVVDIIKDGATFAQVIQFLKGQATDGAVARFFPIVQTVVDRGDSGAYTRHVVAERLPGFDAARPQVLMQMVIDDDTVPNSTNLFFARGLGVPHVGDELLKIGVIPHEAKLPISKNLDGTHTGGVFQYDVVYSGAGPMTKKATHGNVAGNPVAIAQTLHFIQTFYEGGASEIIDPYRTLGIKP